MAELKYITLFLDRQKEFNMLSDEQAGKLIKGIFEYGATGEELASDDLTVNILFSVIKAQLDEVANKKSNPQRLQQSGKCVLPTYRVEMIQQTAL